MTNVTRKVFVILTVLLLLTGLTAAGVSATALGEEANGSETDYYLGDVNSENDVTVSDAIMILRHIVGLDTFGEDLTDDEALQRADVNLDGKVAVDDAIFVLRYIVGLADDFIPTGIDATVMTETALLFVLNESEVSTIYLARDIELEETLLIDREITLNGTEALFGISGEITIADAVQGFTATNIGLDTLNLSGGGNINIINGEVKELNVNAEVTINIDENSSVDEAYFYSAATVTGGNNIDYAYVDADLNPETIFGDDKPENLDYTKAFWTDPEHWSIPVFDGENQVFLTENFELGLGFEAFEATFSKAEVELGGVFASVEHPDLIVSGVMPHGEHEHHYYVTLEGNLNISSNDWYDYWSDEANEDYMIGTITVLASGHTGDEDLTAEVHIYPEDLHPLTPHFTVSPLHGGAVDGHEWPQDTGITITIENDGDVEILTEGEITTGGDGRFNYRVGYDNPIHPGDIITVSVGGFTREHTVRYIEVTDFDLENDLIFGKADAGSIVEVRVFDHEVDFHDMPFRAPQAEPDGNWSADFSISVGDEPSEQPYDLYPGLYGSVEVYDENGNATMYYWGIPNPEFTVEPDKDSISGFDWPDGENAVEIKIQRGDDTIYFETVTATNSWFDVSLEIGIQAGDLVTVTSGVYSASHTVTSLSMTVNRENGEVSGMADPNKVIYLQLQQPAGFDGPPQIIEAVEIDEFEADGSWAYDFEMPIEDNQTVSAEQRGDDGGKTAVYNSLD